MGGGDGRDRNKREEEEKGEKGQSDQAEDVCETALSSPLPLNHLQCFPFTCAVPSCVPLLYLTALALVVLLDKLEPLVVILEFLSCRGTRHMRCLPFQTLPFQFPDTYSISLSPRSQFWLGVNNEIKQEGKI